MHHPKSSILNSIIKGEMSDNQLIKSSTRRTKRGCCLACGKDILNARRRYCSKDCRKQILWVLSLSKGLLRIFNARYAAFSFNKNSIALDILPVWSKDISRFAFERRTGKKPAQDLKKLILHSAEEWYHIIDNNKSKSYASFFLLKKNHDQKVTIDSIKPNKKVNPRFSKYEKESMKLLHLKLDELTTDGQVSQVKSAYKRLAKIHHPDVGGDAEKFKKLNEAHQLMLSWAENPLFTSKKALDGCWSYDAFTNRWAPPL